jgi:hypothetical protein
VIRGKPEGARSATRSRCRVAAGQHVQHLGPVDDVLARQQVGRISRPEQDAAAPQIGAPSPFAHRYAALIEPAARRGLGDLSAPLTRGRGGKVAQPDEALQMVGEIGRQRRVVIVEPAKRHGLAAKMNLAGNNALARDFVPGHRILGHGEQPQRVAPAQLERVERGPPAQEMEPFGQAGQRRRALVANPHQAPPRGDVALLAARLDPLQQAHAARSLPIFSE